MPRISVRRLAFALGCWMACHGDVTGQVGDNAPFVYDQFFQNYYLLNPANPAQYDKVSLDLGNRTLTGLFEGVNRFYADAHLAIRPVGASQFQAVGLQASNNRDGEYLNRNRLYARYHWSTALGERSSLSAGASLGMVNYQFKGSVASPGGSSTKPDANFGIWYHHTTWQIGAAYQQLLRPTLRPLNQSYTLPSYFNFNAVATLAFSEQVQMVLHGYAWMQRPTTWRIELAPVLLLYQVVQAGFNFRQDRGIALLAGVKGIPVGEGTVRFMVSYLVSTRRLSSMDDGVVELSLGIHLPWE